MKRLQVLRRIMKQTGADRMLLGFAAFYLVASIIIWITEPDIRNLGDALWYCFAVISTIGFGDVIATTFIARIISTVLSIYAALVLAIVTGVVVNYYNQIVALRQSETLAAILDRLENLAGMSENELQELSQDIKDLRKKR